MNCKDELLNPGPALIPVAQRDTPRANTRNGQAKFYARPHPEWQANSAGSPVVIDGKLQAVLDANGNAVIRVYTLAIGNGKQETRLSSAPPIPWPSFQRKWQAEQFIASQSTDGQGQSATAEATQEKKQ